MTVDNALKKREHQVVLQQTQSGSKFLKPKDFAQYEACLIEPFDIEWDVPSKNPRYKPQDLLHVNITSFTKEALDGGTPEIIKHGIFSQKTMSRAYGKNLHAAFAAKFIAKQGDEGQFFVPVEVDPAVFDKLAAYLDQRDSAVKAAMEGDEPSFLSED